MLHRLVILKADLAEKIKTEKGEYNDPYCKINLSVKNAPMVGLICYAEEFKTKGHLYESKYDLHSVKPATSALLEFLQE